MQTIKLLIEFEGTDFHGWQDQPNVRTVQGVLGAALRDMCGGISRFRSSSRTDAGVHARAMPVVFNSQRDLPMDAYLRGLNGVLPPDVKVRDAQVVHPDFNPRAASFGKVYEYRIWVDRLPSPLQRRTSWHVPGRLDLGEMEKAAEVYIGTHDFDAFRSAHCESGSSVREIFSSKLIVESPQVWVYRVYGDAFLRNMVRILVGTLVDVGLGKLASDRITAILASKDRAQAGRTAPPQGLFLHEVLYP
jgi:tRNA pseudouridine38-40 synthase